MIQDQPVWLPGRKRRRIPIFQWECVEFAVRIQAGSRAAGDMPWPGEWRFSFWELQSMFANPSSGGINSPLHSGTGRGIRPAGPSA